MNTKLVVMLTHNDVTVSNAIEIFEQCKDLPVRCWGFKDVGLELEEMKKLASMMRAANKETFLECVSYQEDQCMAAAKIAIECRFDYFVGTIFYDSVYQVLKEANMKYMPFCGKVSGSPSILGGSIEEIVADAKALVDKGVYGLDLLAYRAVDCDPEELIKIALKEIDAPILVAGSINGFERIDFELDLNSWGYTMGGALFTENFAKGDFYENLKVVSSYMQEKGCS